MKHPQSLDRSIPMPERRGLTSAPSSKALQPFRRPRAGSIALLAILTLSVQGCSDSGGARTLTANGVVYTEKLLDHSDGVESPPPYGLRLDGVEWAVATALENILGIPVPGDVGMSDTWGFSFEQDAANVTGTFDEDAGTFNISGISFGGRDLGDTNVDGTGRYIRGEVFIDFTYFGVTADDLQKGVIGVSAVGFITFLNANGIIPEDTIVGLVGYPQTDAIQFQLAADNHRLSCPGDKGCDSPVGRGWLAISGIRLLESDPFIFDTPFHTDAQDWLFTTNIPSPSP